MAKGLIKKVINITTHHGNENRNKKNNILYLPV